MFQERREQAMADGAVPEGEGLDWRSAGGALGTLSAGVKPTGSPEASFPINIFSAGRRVRACARCDDRIPLLAVLVFFKFTRTCLRAFPLSVGRGGECGFAEAIE